VGEPTQEDLVNLGKRLFHDKTLSNPPGMACVTCHAPETGYSYPNSAVNWLLGEVPGAVKGRFGNRKPPSLAYATYLPPGPPHYDADARAYVGGLFWDGRANDAISQVKSPMVNPNEMNDRDSHGASVEMIVRKVANGPSGKFFRTVFGQQVFSKPAAEVFSLVAKAIVAYEASPEVSPFTSKYDAYLAGKARLTPQELLGLRLATGTLNGRPNGIPFKKSAHCMDCHALSADRSRAPDLWTNSCYANLGVPRNPLNPFYSMTQASRNSAGVNRDGARYVDLGLGGYVYASLGLPEGSLEGSDPLRINGLFKAPSLRNVDKRPYPGFVKCYMHNGFFKSLKSVVHFYNTRNLTTYPGEVIDFTRPDPYAELKGKPLWPKPEDMDPITLINPAGQPAGGTVRNPKNAIPSDPDADEIGDLKLNDSQEDDIVAFLKTLSDGYGPTPSPDAHRR